MELVADLPFTCNVCGHRGVFQQVHLSQPEMASCAACRSNVRFRWLVHRLSLEFFGRGIPLPEFPVDKSIVGLGLTDPPLVAAGLARCFTYRNTYLTTEPRFDIRFDRSPLGSLLDFLIASEVFEHVEPPVMAAFQNAARLLNQSGILLLTTPWVWDGDRATAIPELYDWKLDADGERWSIVNRKRDGSVERFDDMSFDGSPGPSLGRTREHFPDGTTENFRNLVFHEGPGLALEMRLFTRGGIEDSLRAAGFMQIEFEMQDTPEFGIIFGYPWSRPVIARKTVRQ
jgi:hypothetical protein